MTTPHAERAPRIRSTYKTTPERRDEILHLAIDLKMDPSDIVNAALDMYIPALCAPKGIPTSPPTREMNEFDAIRALARDVSWHAR